MTPAFCCPLCGSDNFGTEGNAYSGTGHCKGRMIYLDLAGNEVLREEARTYRYAGCTFRWSRRDDATVFVGAPAGDGIARTDARCPACIYERTIIESIGRTPEGEEEPGLFAFAWCMGAAHALAATSVDDVFKSFSLCQHHGRTVIEAMGDHLPPTPNTERTH